MLRAQAAICNHKGSWALTLGMEVRKMNGTPVFGVVYEFLKE